MKTIEVIVSMGLVGCRRTTTIEVEEDLSDEEIEEQARDAMFESELISWSWRAVEDDSPTPKRKRKGAR